MDQQKQLSFYGKLLGNPVASMGGIARAKSLSAKRRKEIAVKAANARWAERESIEMTPMLAKSYPELARMHANDKIISKERLLASINEPIRFGR